MSDSLRSPPGSFVHGISQAGILEWVAVSFSRGSSQPRDQTHISCNTFGYLVITPRRYWRTAVCQAGILKLFVLFRADVCDFQTHKMLQLSIPENRGLCLCEASGHAQLIKWSDLAVSAATCSKGIVQCVKLLSVYVGFIHMWCGWRASLRGVSLAGMGSSGFPQTCAETAAPGIKQLGGVHGDASPGRSPPSFQGKISPLRST